MTRKRRATRESVPAKAQGTQAARVHLAKHGEKIVGPKRRTTQESDVHPYPQVARSSVWKLEEAKAKFSEVVRRAHDQGPQYVTVRGKQAVAIIDAAELERLLPPNPAVVPLVQFLESLYVEGLDLTRDRDLGREAAL
jgi:prevent-host-death family protein